MRVPEGSDRKYAEVELAASKDRARPSIGEPYLEIREIGDERKGWLQATDSYILARIPVELDPEDQPGSVPADALKAARKAKHTTEYGVRLNGAAEVNVDGAAMSFPRMSEVNFPTVEQLIPEPSREGFTVGLNAEYLARLAKSLGATEIRLTFQTEGIGADTEGGVYSNLKPIVVRPVRRTFDSKGNDDQRVGLIMPVRIQGEVR